MEFFQTKINNIQQSLKKRGLADSRVVILIAVVFIALSVFWNGAKIIQQNFELQQKVAQIEAENDILELENRNKELQNEYLKTDEFADITARRVFGRASSGETVYIVPLDVALGALSTVENREEQSDKISQKPQWQQNIEAWFAIYFGR